MPRLLIFLLMLITTPVWAQTQITWETLRDVRFTSRYHKEAGASYYVPHFGASVKALEGKEVYLKGYMLPLLPEENMFILSSNPYSSCFFCGTGGPESIVELRLKPGHPRFKMDQVVTIQGKLKLNQDDINQCNYILDEAEVY
ncbi:hypothetical protein SAMN05421823_12018 [Catalinimonas alkaloidigena]|uniref:DUF3299 domain-containing protein n=1 Tax=Catalinimonas alkaloidigena TaxID=1075417 RepID=A0A1G9VFF7_9BACT|nr:DUF3299 domain-containing protein [Catalinimonas alkaloidigena]SDM70836.1 hypothetical protein SAMN05421823_12018 [Catalinimonas alkaloidigena]